MLDEHAGSCLDDGQYAAEAVLVRNVHATDARCLPLWNVARRVDGHRQCRDMGER